MAKKAPAIIFIYLNVFLVCLTIIYVVSDQTKTINYKENWSENIRLVPFFSILDYLETTIGWCEYWNTCYALSRLMTFTTFQLLIIPHYSFHSESNLIWILYLENLQCSLVLLFVSDLLTHMHACTETYACMHTNIYMHAHKHMHACTQTVLLSLQIKSN